MPDRTAPYTVQKQQLASIPVAVIRKQARGTELSRVVPASCGKVWEALRAQGIKGGRNIAIYWDSRITVDAGVEVVGEFIDEGDVVRSATPAGSVLSVTHFGPYSGLGAAHDAVHEFSTEHGHRLTGVRWEIYGHWQDEWNADPSPIRTDVYYQLV